MPTYQKKNQNKNKKRTPTNEGSRSSLWNNFKRSNIHITAMPECQKEKRRSKKLEIYLKK